MTARQAEMLASPQARAAQAPAAADPSPAAGVSNPKQKASGYERDPLDWYVEPAWCTELLAAEIDFKSVWDPACGCGTIPKVFSEIGSAAHGTDIVVRWSWQTYTGDFFTVKKDRTPYFTDIVTNPPYRLAEAFIRRAFELDARKIAVLVRLDFLASQKRYKLFTDLPPQYVFVLSRRPSMPPGGSNVPAKGGMHDVCWIIWDALQDAPTEMRWLK